MAIGPSSTRSAGASAPGLAKVSVQTGTCMVACHCPAAAWQRSSSTSARSSALARSPAHMALRAPFSTAHRLCLTSCSIASRRSIRLRSTWPPASRTCSTTTLPSRPRCWPRSSNGAATTRPMSASPTRARRSSCTRRARRRSARTSASCGSCRPRTRFSAAQERKLSYLFEQLAIAGTREHIERYIRPVPRSIPAPAALTAVGVARD